MPRVTLAAWHVATRPCCDFAPRATHTRARRLSLTAAACSCRRGHDSATVRSRAARRSRAGARPVRSLRADDAVRHANGAWPRAAVRHARQVRARVGAWRLWCAGRGLLQLREVRRVPPRSRRHCFSVPLGGVHSDTCACLPLPLAPPAPSRRSRARATRATPSRARSRTSSAASASTCATATCHAPKTKHT
jgi:hypothetical protein